MTTSAEVRTRLIEALQLDLVEPTADDIDHGEEILPQAHDFCGSGYHIMSG